MLPTTKKKRIDYLNLALGLFYVCASVMVLAKAG